MLDDAKALGVPLDTRAYNIALRACHSPGKTLRQEQLMQVRQFRGLLGRAQAPGLWCCWQRLCPGLQAVPGQDACDRTRGQLDWSACPA